MEKLTRQELVTQILKIVAASNYAGIRFEYEDGQDALRESQEMLSILIKRIYELEELT